MFDGSHYIEKVDIAKIIKMGSLHASQKWSLSENKVFFVLNYQNIGCKLIHKEEKSWISETSPFLN